MNDNKKPSPIELGKKFIELLKKDNIKYER